jgi:hypothetical protein
MRYSYRSEWRFWGKPADNLCIDGTMRFLSLPFYPLRKLRIAFEGKLFRIACSRYKHPYQLFQKALQIGQRSFARAPNGQMRL